MGYKQWYTVQVSGKIACLIGLRVKMEGNGKRQLRTSYPKCGYEFVRVRCAQGWNHAHNDYRHQIQDENIIISFFDFTEINRPRRRCGIGKKTCSFLLPWLTWFWSRLRRRYIGVPPTYALACISRMIKCGKSLWDIFPSEKDDQFFARSVALREINRFPLIMNWWSAHEPSVFILNFTVFRQNQVVWLPGYHRTQRPKKSGKDFTAAASSQEIRGNRDPFAGGMATISTICGGNHGVFRACPERNGTWRSLRNTLEKSLTLSALRKPYNATIGIRAQTGIALVVVWS
jgi:hypothetical protein